LAFFLAFLRESVRLWVQMSPYLLLGMLIGGALHVMLIFERFLPLLTTRTLYFQASGGSLQDEGTKI